MDLLDEFREDLAFYYKYFEGPRLLKKAEHLMCANGGDNDCHLVAYVKDLKDSGCLRRLKQFRKFNQTNQTSVFNFQYWMVEDPNIATQLGMDTSEETVGDVYLVRKQSVLTGDASANAVVSDYPFISHKLMTAKEMNADSERAQAKIFEIAFNSPFVVKDDQQFF
jgi:hypothetical protein